MVDQYLGFNARITSYNVCYTKLLRVRASTEAGLFYGLQTLRQLLPPRFESTAGRDTVRSWDLPCCMIQDAPRFPWRGLLLDCCRHFMDVEFVT